jgi:hypothetical protein
MRYATLTASLAIALVACKTDVSTPSTFGTQGHVVSGVSDLIGMAAGRDGVFWTDGRSIQYCPRAGCSSPTQFYATSDGKPHVARLAADDSSVYWTEYDHATPLVDFPGGGRVESCPQAGCQGSPKIVFSAPDATVASTPQGGTPDLGFLAVDQGLVYWTATSPVSPDSTSILLFSTAKGGPESIPQGMTPRQVLNGVLYATLANTAVASIVSCPAVGVNGSIQTPSSQCETPDSVVTGPPVQSMVVDGTNLYFEAKEVDSQEYVYWSNLSIRAYWTVFESSGLGFAERGGYFYTATTTSTFATCLASTCSSDGPQPLDLPFTVVQLDQVVPAPSIVPDSQGAYAYGAYTIPSESVGLTATIMAIVYLPAPAP